MQTTTKSKALNLFLAKTDFAKSDIESIFLIESGSSNNANFLFTTKNKEKFQVKIPMGLNVEFKDIKTALLYDSDIYIYLNENGQMIKKWIEGKHPTFSKKNEALWVLSELEKIHKIKVDSSKMGMYDIYAYRENSNLDIKLLEEFDFLAKRLEKHDISFIHGDVNTKNIIVNNTRAFLIDFEWSKIGYTILDYAYLAAFSEIAIKDIVDFTKYSLKELNEMIRFVLIHTLMWCEKENTAKSLLLKKEIMIKVNG